MRNGRNTNLVLLAEDDLFVRKVLRTALEGMTQCIEVADGAQVLEAYREHMPDMVFLDIHLPNASGLEILPQLIALDPNAYVVMLSADSAVGNVKQAMEIGGRGFLTKPFEKQRLLKYFNDCPTIRFADSI